MPDEQLRLSPRHLEILHLLADGGRLVPTDTRTYRAELADGTPLRARVQQRVLLRLHLRGLVRHWHSANGYVITAAGLIAIEQVASRRRAA